MAMLALNIISMQYFSIFKVKIHFFRNSPVIRILFNDSRMIQLNNSKWEPIENTFQKT